MRGGFYQDLAFFSQDPVLFAQPPQLVALLGRQAVLARARIEIRLLDPQAQGFAGQAEITGNGTAGFAAGAHQADRFCPKLRWIRLDRLGCFLHGPLSWRDFPLQVYKRPLRRVNFRT
jgi:hypothetical protein